MYKLKNESEHHYEIETPEGQSFHVAKEGLSAKMHANIKKYAEGGEVTDVGDIAPTGETEVTSPISDVVAPTGKIKEYTAPIIPGAPKIGNTPTSPEVAQKFEEAYKQEESAARGAAEAKAGLGEAQQKIEHQKATSLQNEAVTFDGANQQRLTTQANLARDLATAKIDPNRYFNNQNTGGKIGTVISLILGGLGGGPGGINSGLKVLNDQIDKDVENQKTDISNKQKAFENNITAGSDERAANIQRRSQILSYAQAKADEQLAKNQTPQAQAAYTLFTAGIKQQQAQLSQQLFLNHLQNTIVNGGEFDATMGQFAPKPDQVAYTGNGKGVYTNSPAGHAKVTEAFSTFNPPIEALENLSSGNVNPLNKTSPEYQAAVSKVATLPLLLKKAFGVGRLNKEFQDIVDRAAANPTELVDKIINHEPRTMALLNTLKSMKQEAIAPHVSGYKTTSGAKSKVGFSASK